MVKIISVLVECLPALVMCCQWYLTNQSILIHDAIDSGNLSLFLGSFICVCHEREFFLFLWAVWWNNVSPVTGTPANCSKAQTFCDWELECRSPSHVPRHRAASTRGSGTLFYEGSWASWYGWASFEQVVNFVFQAFCSLHEKNPCDENVEVPHVFFFFFK